MFALGFAAGSVVTFFVLALWGFREAVESNNNSNDRDELERYYWIGYKKGVEDERATGQRIDQLPISKN